MGIFLTLLYILTTYLTPPVVFGPLAAFHIQIVIAIPTMIVSFMKLQEQGVGKKSQSWAVGAMLFAVFMSFVFNGLTREAPTAFLDYFPTAMAFFFVSCNLRKKIHLQMLAGVLLFVTVFIVIQSQLAERTGDPKAAGTYFISMGNDLGQKFFRIQGLGVLGDPNDTGQFMLALIPFLFFFWVKGKSFLNLLRVYLPVAATLTGIFLTHSRGAMLGVTAVLFAAFRKKLGTVPSAIAGVLMLGGMMAAGFTGGREVSANSGEDRMAAWSIGLQLIRSHPLFGVGYYHFTDYYHITAHNTIVVCAAETGLFGFFFWVVFVVSSIRDGYVVSTYGLKDKKAEKEKEEIPRFGARHAPAAALPSLAYAGPKFSAGPTSSALLDPQAMRISTSTFTRPGGLRMQTAPPTVQPAAASPARPNFEKVENAPSPLNDIRRMANLVVLSFVGLLVTGWFLSRAFAMVFPIYGAIATVVFRMAQEAGMEIPVLDIGKAMKLAILPTVILISIVYVILRFDHLH